MSLKLNHFICPTCGHDFYAESAHAQCDACYTHFYATHSLTCNPHRSTAQPTQTVRVTGGYTLNGQWVSTQPSTEGGS